MGSLLKLIAGSGLANAASQPEAITKLGRKLYLNSVLLIGFVWYTGWRRERVSDSEKSSFPLPFLTRKKGNVYRLSSLPGLQPFMKVLPIPSDSGSVGAQGL